MRNYGPVLFSFGKRTGKIADFYASFDADRSPNWKCGKGDCSNKSYKVVVTTKNSKTNKALKGATVKYGSKTLGKSDSKGKVTGWLKPGTYKFKATKSSYNSATSSKKVGVSGLNLTLKLSPKGAANEEFYFIDDIYDLNDEEYAEFVADDEFVSNCLFLVRDASDLQKLANLVNNTSRDTSKLRFVMNNATGTIDMTGVALQPIGTEERPFMSEFDGNKMTITGLTIESDFDYVGLFGNVKDAEIFDLGITNAVISGNDNVGIIAGKVSGNSKIYDTYVTGAVSGSNNVGALLGSVDKADVLNSYSTANVSGNSYVGGIIGYVGAPGTYTMSDLENTANISGADYVGGVFGGVVNQMSNYSDFTINLSQLKNSGDITGSGNYVGGIAGYLTAESNYSITLCSADLKTRMIIATFRPLPPSMACTSPVPVTVSAIRYTLSVSVFREKLLSALTVTHPQAVVSV